MTTIQEQTAKLDEDYKAQREIFEAERVKCKAALATANARIANHRSEYVYARLALMAKHKTDSKERQ